MARAQILAVETPLPLRGGAESQIAALAPFPARPRRDHWQFDRLPYYHHLLFAGGGHSFGAELTREAARTLREAGAATEEVVAANARRLDQVLTATRAAEGATPGATTRARPAAPRVTRATELLAPAGLGAAIQPRRETYVLAFDDTVNPLEVHAVSTPVIPYDATVTGFWWYSAGGVTLSSAMNLFESDEAYSGVAPNPPGRPLMTTRVARVGTPLWYIDLDDFGAQVTPAALGSMLLGPTVITRNKHLTLGYRVGSDMAPGVQVNLTVVVTLEERLAAAAELTTSAPSEEEQLALAAKAGGPGAEAATAKLAEIRARDAAARAAAAAALTLQREKAAAALAQLQAKNAAARDAAIAKAQAQAQATRDAAAREAATVAARAAAAAQAAEADAAARAQELAIAQVRAATAAAAPAARAAPSRPPPYSPPPGAQLIWHFGRQVWMLAPGQLVEQNGAPITIGISFRSAFA